MTRTGKVLMYGSEKTDPVVKYYDDSFAIGSDEEIEWYLEKVKSFGGPILDGRIIKQIGYRKYR